MPQTAAQRRAAQRRLAQQIKEGTYTPSSIGSQARRKAAALGSQQPPNQPAAAASILRTYQADDAWEIAEEQMAGSEVDRYGPPVRSINPKNPRIRMMEWWRGANMVKVYWGDGRTPYVFFEISQPLWTQWKLSASPGRFLNRNLAGKPYMPAPF